MASQKEIARKLKFSQSTVSRALNNDRALPLSTKLKVKQCAIELGYEPRRYNPRPVPVHETVPGRRLLALVHHALPHNGQYHSLLIEILQGLIQSASMDNLVLIVKEVENMEAAKKIVEEYSNNVIGAVVIYKHPEEVVSFFCNNLPCVSLNHRYANVRIPVVESKQEAAFDQMFHYLYNRGHRRIGFAAEQDNPFAFARYAGYLQAANQLGCACDPGLSVNISAERHLPLDAMAEWVMDCHRSRRMEALLCSSGNLAKAIIERLESHGLRVPEDLSLAAFDDILMPGSSGLLLCGMQANYELVARMAIKVLSNAEAFAGASVIGCDVDFHIGNTVADRVPEA